MTSETDLAGIKVLIVEDESLVSLFIEDVLTDIGCKIVGVATNLADAAAKVEKIECDVVLLDVNLHGVRTFGLAEILCDKKQPFVFSTGYGTSGLPVHLQHVPVLQKPFHEHELIQKLCLTLSTMRSEPIKTK